MSTPHDCSFNQLFHNISQILTCGDRKQVKEINYRRPIRVVNRKLVHDTVQIQNDVDVQQMSNRWKSTQLLKPSVQYEDSTTRIELFVQTKNVRSARPRISLRLRG